jgi:hypothetical protein
MKGKVTMDTAVVWAIVTFIAGAISGGFIVDHFLGKTYKKHYDELCEKNNRLAAERTKAIENRERLLNLEEERVNNSLHLVPRDKPPLSEQVKKYRTSEPDDRPNPPRDKRNLEDEKQDPDEGEDENEEDEEDEEDYDPSGPGDDLPLRVPFTILEEPFKDDYLESVNVTVDYYQEDGVLADERDAIIEDPIGAVGETAIEVLLTTDQPAIYVHNDTYDINYEIVVHHGVSYRRDIMGDELD